MREELDLRPADRVALVGSGGKTTVFWELAREYAGQKVLLTTTTRMGLPPADYPFCEPGAVPALWPASRGLFVGYKLGEKVSGPTPAQLDSWELPGLDLLVVEADGSRGVPVKAHADHEPVLPLTTTVVVAVLGMLALGMRAGEAHRAELLCQRLGCDPELRLGESHLAMVLEGYLERAPAPRQVIVLNQADDERLKSAANRIGRRLRVPFVVRGRS